MTLRRVSIAGLMGVVALAALGFAVIKDPSEWWSSCLFWTDVALLLFALLGIVFSGDGQRRFWAAFAVFGWGYLIACVSTGGMKPPPLPTTYVIDSLFQAYAPPQTVATPDKRITISGPIRFQYSDSYPNSLPFFRIGHSLATLLVALSGTVLARIFPGREDPSA